MARVLVGAPLWYAWKGSSLLAVNARGECGDDHPSSGFYFRETRYLRTLSLTVNGEPPWLCQAAAREPDTLEFDFAHPELTVFGGGGTGQSRAEDVRDHNGVPYRALDLRVRYRTGVNRLTVECHIANLSLEPVSLELRWDLGADFADIQETLNGERQQQAPVGTEVSGRTVRFEYWHESLPLGTLITGTGGHDWTPTETSLTCRLRLESQEESDVGLVLEPLEGGVAPFASDAEEREHHALEWAERFARITTPQRTIAGEILERNFRDLASFPLLDGRTDEWLAMQAGIPLYPALWGRDALTAGWQAAFIDRGESLDSTLTRLGRLQGTRDDDWRDEEPGRIIQQVRSGPLARLGIIPEPYYGDFASPFMFVIALAHFHSWDGTRARLARHWDVARRIMDWARTRGDRDGDGYLEYLSRSPKGTEHQGWKDSGDAVVYDDGTPVRLPAATCELQGYWYAAQQVMAAMSLIMGSRGDARAYWRSAEQLKERFNRDWWVEEQQCVAFAMDADKNLIRSVTSNAGQCLATGIVSAGHMPALVGRLFAPDLFSGWGIRTLSTGHAAYHPVSYHRGSVWAVENATIVFGLRRFGFDARALDLSKALFDLAALYPDYRIPECVGGHARRPGSAPGVYPRANAPQLWNASAFALVLHSILGLQPVAPMELLVVDPALPSWLPDVLVRDLRVGNATVTIRFWRDPAGRSHAEVIHRQGTLRVIRQPPPESLTAGAGDRFRALFETVVH